MKEVKKHVLIESINDEVETEEFLTEKAARKKMLKRLKKVCKPATFLTLNNEHEEEGIFGYSKESAWAKTTQYGECTWLVSTVTYHLI